MPRPIVFYFGFLFLKVFMMFRVWHRSKGKFKSYLPFVLKVSVYFLPIGIGTGTDSIGKNSVKIKQIGNFLAN